MPKQLFQAKKMKCSMRIKAWLRNSRHQRWCHVQASVQTRWPTRGQGGTQKPCYRRCLPGSRPVGQRRLAQTQPHGRRRRRARRCAQGTVQLHDARSRAAVGIHQLGDATAAAHHLQTLRVQNWRACSDSHHQHKAGEHQARQLMCGSKDLQQVHGSVSVSSGGLSAGGPRRPCPALGARLRATSGPSSRHPQQEPVSRHCARFCRQPCSPESP